MAYVPKRKGDCLVPSLTPSRIGKTDPFAVLGKESFFYKRNFVGVALLGKQQHKDGKYEQDNSPGPCTVVIH